MPRPPTARTPGFPKNKNLWTPLEHHHHHTLGGIPGVDSCIARSRVSTCINFQNITEPDKWNEAGPDKTPADAISVHSGQEQPRHLGAGVSSFGVNDPRRGNQTFFLPCSLSNRISESMGSTMPHRAESSDSSRDSAPELISINRVEGRCPGRGSSNSICRTLGIIHSLTQDQP